MHYTKLLDDGGKPLGKLDYKLLGRLVAVGLLPEDDAEQEAREFINPYTGARVKLVGFSVRLAEFILKPEHAWPTEVDIRHWHRARMIFRVCWPEEYYKLID